MRHVLIALSVQSRATLEIIVVDNHSQDDSVEIARTYGAIVVHVPQGQFTYGLALKQRSACGKRQYLHNNERAFPSVRETLHTFLFGAL